MINKLEEVKKTRKRRNKWIGQKVGSTISDNKRPKLRNSVSDLKANESEPQLILLMDALT